MSPQPRKTGSPSDMKNSLRSVVLVSIGFLLAACQVAPEAEGEFVSADPGATLDPSREPLQEASPPEGSIMGDCNAQGSGNNVHCITVMPRNFESLAGISMDWFGDAGSAQVLFNGGIDELPTPPAYENAWNHCDEWEEWFQEQSNIYRFNTDIHMALNSGEPDVVAIKNVSVDVFSRIDRPVETTIISCSYGAGGDHGNIITVDVGTGETNLHMMESGDVSPMPPASLSLQGQGFESALVKTVSTNGYLYEGQIVIDAVINGEQHIFQQGTKEQPVRWVGGGFDAFFEILESSSGVDWHPVNEEWDEEFHPSLVN